MSDNERESNMNALPGFKVKSKQEGGISHMLQASFCKHNL